MRFFALALFGSFLGVLGSSGCGGGGSGAPACSTTFTACGGDLTGTWTYVEDCNGPSVMVPNCPAATSNVSTNVSGTVTFNADKTYAVDLTVAQTGTGTIPASCLGGGVITSCSELNQDKTTDGLTTKTTCTGDATQSCTCTISVTGTATATGTYMTAGNDLTLTPKGQQAGTPTGYCVNGNAFELGGGTMGGTSPNAYAIFTK